jgi:hypothetical protein
MIRNLGVIECTVVNVDTRPHNAQIEILFSFGSNPSPIGGVLQPGGFWFIWQTGGAEHARGVARVFQGSPNDIRAMCTSKTTLDGPSGIVVQAE